MRGFFGVMTALGLLLTAAVGFAAPTAQQAPRDVLVTKGVVQSVDGDRVVVTGEGAQAQVDLLVTDSSYVIRGSDGAKLTLDQLPEGTPVTAYYGPRLTRSLPPQGQAIALVVGAADDGAFYVKAAQVEQLATGDARILDSNGDAFITIRRADFPDTAQLREGSELLVWYKMMALSLPGQATATKTVLLKAGADIDVDFTAGTIAVQGRRLAAGQPAAVREDGVAYLPVRSVAEALGYEVRWDAQNQSVALRRGAQTARLAIGSVECAKAKQRVRLTSAPRLVDGVTFAPAEFFAEALELELRVKD